jgi:hypothetical protein
VPVLFPPSLYVHAGSGGVYLADQVTLFPSASAELQITTTDGGGLTGSPVTGDAVQLLMSDSGSKNYTSVSGTGSFSAMDHSPTLWEMNNPNPVVLNISGSMNNVELVTPKETQITIGGDLINSSFSGQNLHASDKTTITVAGRIFNSPSFSSVILQSSPTVVGPQDLPPKLPGLSTPFYSWRSIRYKRPRSLSPAIYPVRSSPIIGARCSCLELRII